MSKNGFTLVELIVVTAIMGIILVIGSLQFVSMRKKSSIEGETRMMQSDILQTRAVAFYQKKTRSVKVSGVQFGVYSTVNGTGTPLKSKTLDNPVMNDVVVSFDTRGISVDPATPSQPNVPVAICVNGNIYDAAVDSVLVNEATVQLGRIQAGGACDTAHIDLK